MTRKKAIGRATTEEIPSSPAKKDNESLRRIPSVERILSSEGVAPLIARFGRQQVKQELAGLLAGIRKGQNPPFSHQQFPEELAQRLVESSRPTLRRVINGTGVLIHTNLGRSPVDSELWREAGESVRGYCNLELDLDSGERGSRDEHVSALAGRLFGCEDAILANNNAAAMLLLLAALAEGREVIVSRGELVEIGGSFRIPEVIQQGGARLREVGTTNRTRAQDYLEAVSRRTAAILRVHRSNFQIVGFTETPSISEMVALARARKLPLLWDEGSGQVVDLSTYGFARSETVGELLEQGVDVVTCSTDKLLGATQGGLILGRRDLLDRCRRHPLMRAVRAGKESYGVVTETLRAFASGRHEERIPLYRMLARSTEALRARATRIAAETGARVIDTTSALGGGTTPAETIPSIGVELKGKADSVSHALLAQDVPLAGRIQNDRFTLDLRTIAPEEDELVVAAIRSLGSPI